MKPDKPDKRPRKRYYPRSRTNPQKPKIKPSIESGLKKVFSKIGTPKPTEFIPDPFQLEAVEAIEKGDCLVTAPTGSGKTWIAQQVIEKVFSNGGRCWYASPLKALSNSKYSEFSKIFGESNTGILTGDRREKFDAPIIIGTTEILRNQLYDAMHQGIDLNTDFVVLDEAHFLGDRDRGVVWEEIMIYLPARIPLLMLSATVGNAAQLADWLSKIRQKQCIIVNATQRPVPLYPLFFHPSGKLIPLQSKPNKKNVSDLSPKVKHYLKSEAEFLPYNFRRLPPFGKILQVLRKYRLLPAIFFLKSRVDCDNAINLCIDNQISDPMRRQKISERFNELVSQIPHFTKYKQRWHIEHLAVAAHHSGQLPAWKLIIETMMTEGLLDAVFATSTVAAGVNFPARTVIFLNSDRFNGKEFVPLDPTEFHQMTGRAGRRGMDQIGFALALPSKFMDLKLIGKLFSCPPSPVNSQIKINFSMALNLLLSHSPVQIELLLDKSFAAFQLNTIKKTRSQGKKRIISDQKVLWQSFLKHLAFLKAHNYVKEDDTLSEDGVWASKLRVDQPLLIAEGFRHNVFPQNDPAILAGIIGSFVNEKEFEDYLAEEQKPKELLLSFYRVKEAVRPFIDQLNRKGFETRTLFLTPAAAIYAWAKGMSWEDMLNISELSEGDMANLILRTADNLRHIRALEQYFPEIANAASEAITLIMKDPIVTYFDF